jgi:hypothetical protein
MLNPYSHNVIYSHKAWKNVSGFRNESYFPISQSPINFMFLYLFFLCSKHSMIFHFPVPLFVRPSLSVLVQLHIQPSFWSSAVICLESEHTFFYLLFTFLLHELVQHKVLYDCHSILTWYVITVIRRVSHSKVSFLWIFLRHFLLYVGRLATKSLQLVKSLPFIFPPMLLLPSSWRAFPSWFWSSFWFHFEAFFLRSLQTILFCSLLIYFRKCLSLNTF